MDYGDIVTRSFRLTWRYKYLWVLGLLAGSGGGSGFSYQGWSGFPGGQSSNTQGGPDMRPVIDWLQTHLALIFALIFLGFLLMVVFFLIASWAAAALVSEISDIESDEETDVSESEERPKRGFLSAWSKGRAAFGRVVGLRFLVGLLVLSYVAVIVIPLVLLVYLIAARSALMVVVGIVVGVVVALLVIAAIPFFIALTISQQYALRYIVLRQNGVADSLKAGFRLLKENLSSTLLLWLITIGVGMAVGLAVMVALLLVAIPVGLFVFIMFQIGPITGVTALALAVLIVVPLLLAAAGAASAYFSTYWTLAFSKLSPLPESLEDLTPL